MKTYFLSVLMLFGICASIPTRLLAQHDGHNRQHAGHPSEPHIMGQVFAVNDYGEPVPAEKARVFWLDESAGTLTDTAGVFHLVYGEGGKRFPRDLIVTATGFENDTLTVEQEGWLEITLSPYSITKIAIKTHRDGTYIDRLNPIQTEVIGENELTAAACCTLSESFANNASVDAVMNDAVTGTREVKLLGLAGVNTQILTDNLPIIRGLGRTHGLDYIPSNWVNSLSVSKGVGSVRNGYESIAGQINIAQRQPTDDMRLFADIYRNWQGRSEVNATYNQPIVKDRLHTQIKAHAAMFPNPPDNNGDNFYDTPIHEDVFLENQWTLSRGDGTMTTFGINGTYDRRQSGTMDFDFDRGPESQLGEYGFDWQTQRVFAYFKSGHRLAKPHQTLGIQATGLIHQQEGLFGQRDFEANQQSAWLNTLYSSHIGSETHKFTMGFSFLFDDIEEQYDTSGYSRTELVPGGYFEHTWIASRRVKMVSGMRLDYHNLYGVFYSPRWHTQFDFSENTVMRVAAGRGYRVPTPFIENISTLVTNRQVRLTDDIQPEVAWNFGGSFVQTAEWGSSWWQFTADYYYTHFENQLIVDRDARQDLLAFYMLDGGRSYAHSAQAGIEVKPVEWLTLKTAYKYRDVQQTIADELRLRPLTARHIWHSVANIDREKWGLNVMLHYVSAQRLPTGPEVPDEYQTGDLSPDYWLLNVHGKYIWRWFEFYVGVENATNLQIEQPIRAADNPESPWFDAAYAWGPVMGAMPYAGIRFRLGE